MTTQLEKWLTKVNKSKLDTAEKCRIYYAVLETYAKRKKHEAEDFGKPTIKRCPNPQQ